MYVLVIFHAAGLLPVVASGAVGHKPIYPGIGCDDPLCRESHVRCILLRVTLALSLQICLRHLVQTIQSVAHDVVRQLTLG